MRSFFARRWLRAASKRYGYDTSYLDYMLKQSPAAFFRFTPVAKAAAHREVVPVDASFAAKITGAMAEDCGPCVQLTVDMALAVGMAKDQIEAVVRRDTGAMNASTKLGFQFADAIVSGSADAEGHREALRPPQALVEVQGYGAGTPPEAVRARHAQSGAALRYDEGGLVRGRRVAPSTTAIARAATSDQVRAHDASATV